MYRPDICHPPEPKPMRPHKGMSKGEDHTHEIRPSMCVRPHPVKPIFPAITK